MILPPFPDERLIPLPRHEMSDQSGLAQRQHRDAAVANDRRRLWRAFFRIHTLTKPSKREYSVSMRRFS